MKTRRIFISLFLVLFVWTSVVRGAEPYAPDNHAKPDPLGAAKSLQGNLSVGEFTGAAIYEYPIALPPGRSGMTPSLSLTYNSQANNMMENLAGYRWDLTQFSIRRANKHGVDRMYDETNFIAETPAGGGELVPIQLTNGQHGEYGLKVEGAFARYQYLDDETWVVTDKAGTQYIFGADQEGQQFDPEDPSRIYAWMLQGVHDLNDNFIRYTYTKINNQLYPRQILYTGHGSEDGIFEVRFSLFVRSDNVNAGYSRGFRVQTDRLIGSIEIYAEGTLRRKLDLAFSNVSSLGWQTITSITETGYSPEGTATALPPTAFQYSESRVGWELTSNYVPDWFIESCDYECLSSNVIQWDMNGDSLDDFEYIGDIDGFSGFDPVRALNNSNGGWNKVTGRFLGNNPFADSTLPNLSQKVLDFNGDTRADIVSSTEQFFNGEHTANSTINFSNGNTVTGVLPLFMQLNLPQAYDNGVVMGDLNGDSLPDMVQRVTYSAYAFNPPIGGQIFDQACLNSGGNRCELTSLWHSPRDIFEYQTPNAGARVMALQDCNLDGLADLQYTGNGADVYINDGKGGWIQDPGNACPFGTGMETNTSRQADLNGDGLTDWVNAYDMLGQRGEIFASVRDVTLRTMNNSLTFGGLFPFSFGVISGPSPKGLGVRILDFNGDLLPDIVQSFSETTRPDRNTAINQITQRAWLNNGERPYFLKSVQSSQGGRVEIEYSTSAQELRANGAQANPNLPINVTVVKTIRTDDSMGTVSELTYAYEDGYYHFNGIDERGLAGFRVITKTDSLGFFTKIYFHQSENSVADFGRGEFEDHFSKSGQPYRVETYDAMGQLVQVAVNRWERRDLGNDRNFPHLTRVVTRFITPATGSTKNTAQEFTYDSFGNQTQVLDYGEVQSTAEDGSFNDIGNDLLRTEQIYVSSSGLYLVGLPAEAQLFDQYGGLLSHQRFYYDALPLGQASRGKPTLQETRLDTDNRWVGTERTYNEFGLLLTETNPRGNAIAFTYDNFHLYPIRVTNPLGHIVENSYDLGTGQVVRAVDPNGVQTVQLYDGLGRLLQVQKSDPENPEAFVTLQTLDYSDVSMPRSVHENANAGNGITVERYVYFDGLGRTIQEKREGERGQFVTTATIFDERGFARKTLQPYFSSTFDFEPIDAMALGQEFTYDALGRVTSITNPLGTTSTLYDGWRQAVTDPNGNSKEYEFNARAKLMAATEHNGAEVYMTHYSYDPLGQLLQMVDAEGNEREFSYDSLGRRLTQTAPHRHEATPSVWNYEYDDNGNLIGRTDPKAQEVRYNYDTLDRLITEDFAGTPNVEYEFLYDEGTYGLGRLSRVRGPSYTREITYDSWGRNTEDRKTIFDRSFALDFEYDLLGGVTALTYPDSYEVSYTYDDAHLLRQAASGEQVFAQVESYSPLGQMGSVRLGNEILVASTYNPLQLYRLTGKLGMLGETHLQDLAYQYDPMGNLLDLRDLSAGPTAKQVNYQYDPLYRLTQAAYTETANQQDITLTYSYSPTGNILQNSDVGAYTYSSTHPHAVVQAGDLRFDYDANGNMSERRGEAMEYDYRDRLMGSVDEVSFLYGEGDQRLAKTDLTTGRIKYYPFEEYEEDFDVRVKYIYLGGLKIAKIETMIEHESDGGDGGGGDEEGDNGDGDDDSGDNDDDGDGGDEEGDDGEDDEENDILPPAPVVELPALSTGGGYRRGVPVLYNPADRRLITQKKPALPLLYSQSESPETLPKKLRPQAVAKSDVGFQNLRIAYEPTQVRISWDVISPEITRFQIYRSKHAYDDPNFGYTSVMTADLKASGGTQEYADTEAPDKFYAYRLVGLNAEGKILVTSIQLDPTQIYLQENQAAEVDFSAMSRMPFDKVVLAPHDLLTAGPAGRTRQLKMTARASVGVGTTVQARFLTCTPKQNGKEACHKVDEKTVKVFVNGRPAQARMGRLRRPS